MIMYSVCRRQGSIEHLSFRISSTIGDKKYIRQNRTTQSMCTVVNIRAEKVRRPDKMHGSDLIPSLNQ